MHSCHYFRCFRSVPPWPLFVCSYTQCFDRMSRPSPCPDPARCTYRARRLSVQCQGAGYSCNAKERVTLTLLCSSISVSAWFDLIRFVSFTSTTAMMLLIDTSICYHWIRGQQLIKLFVVFNVLEVHILGPCSSASSSASVSAFSSCNVHVH